MKRVLTTLALLALAGAAFAATINDPGVTAYGWHQGDDPDVMVYDLEDDNGFTSPCDEYGSVAFYMSSADGWIFDPNETVTVSVFEDFGRYMSAGREIENVYVYVGAAYMDPTSMSDRPSMVIYRAPYDGPGDYTLSLFSNTGISDGDPLNTVMFALADESGNLYYSLDMPAYSTLTVRFNAEKPETDVPEPATCAYALMGLGSLLGIKRKIRK